MYVSAVIVFSEKVDSVRLIDWVVISICGVSMCMNELVCTHSVWAEACVHCAVCYHGMSYMYVEFSIVGVLSKEELARHC